MAVKALVTFTREVEAVVVGETMEEINAAIENFARDEKYELDNDWGGDWDANAYEIKPKRVVKGRQIGLLTQEQIDAHPCHCGIVDGEMVDISDYNKAKGTSIEEPDD